MAGIFHNFTLVCLLLYKQKLQERNSILRKSTMTEKTKEKWSKVLIPEAISSEESENEDGHSVFVKPLPWRAKIVNDFFAQLDTKIMETKSSQPRGNVSNG